jgi:DNA helicase IV
MSELAAAADGDLAYEQQYLDVAHESLSAMRRRAEQLLDDVRAAGAPDPDYARALEHRVSVLGESTRPLIFGRIDEIAGDSFHLGRRHVEDGVGDPMVIDWRAPVATPFYRARPGEPLGLSRRRQILVEDHKVLATADDRFSGEEADESGPQLRGGDALLAELERARTGEMLDIVSTIQLEQDEVIRAPFAGVTAVQGGPGTGKTAIGLHRAAYLLYNHPELVRDGVLVVGPSRAFLRYIAQVLPSLGEEAVVQATIPDLVRTIRPSAAGSDESSRVKGSARMAEVLRRLLLARLSRTESDLAVAIGLSRIVIPADTINRLVEELSARSGPYRAGRSALRTRLIGLVHGELSRSGKEIDDVRLRREITRDGALGAMLDRLWPSVSATDLVVELCASAARLRAAADGILSEEEQRAMLRPAAATNRRTAYDVDDLALVDEAAYLIDGRAPRFGHVVIDEVQDLSGMQLRMLARRAPGGSMTVLGDLAQATSAASSTSWEELLANLPTAAGLRRTELTLGYRAPAQVLELASRLLPLVAPGVTATRSVRAGRSEPTVLNVPADEVIAAAAEEAMRLAATGMLVGLVAADDAVLALHRALVARGQEAGLVDRDGMGHPVVVASARSAKGLEFDAVVVVEPDEIAAGAIRGLRLLYVALTRPMQHLSIVHARPLPALLAAAG